MLELLRRSILREVIQDDIAYILPMGIFLLLVQAGASWPHLYVACYLARTLIVPALLIFLWNHYTKIDWSYAGVGIFVGILGVVQWVGMEKLLLFFAPNYPRASVQLFDPFQSIPSPGIRWMFIAVRWAGASLVVPVMEELFWRDFLWRSLSSSDFKRVKIGQFAWAPFLAVSVIFATVHVQWATAFIWSLLIGLLLVMTRSLGACIIAHSVTNLLLGAYVLRTHDWYFW